MLVYGIPSYKLEKDVVDAEIEVLRQMGVDIRCGVEVGRDITLDTLRREGYKAFYVAIGCQDGRSAGIPGEDTAGVMTAVDFLHAVAENETYPVEGRAVAVRDDFSLEVAYPDGSTEAVSSGEVSVRGIGGYL